MDGGKSIGNHYATSTVERHISKGTEKAFAEEELPEHLHIFGEGECKRHAMLVDELGAAILWRLEYSL